MGRMQEELKIMEMTAGSYIIMGTEQDPEIMQVMSQEAIINNGADAGDYTYAYLNYGDDSGDRNYVGPEAGSNHKYW